MTSTANVDFPVFATFREVADTSRYVALPDGWTLAVADVAGSTQAIEAGRYKAVNMAGAAVIAAVSNALDQAPFPFAFGGDGASFVVPPESAEAALSALAATATLVHEEFGFDLRIAAVPIAAIREAGLDIKVARFAASPDVTYAMFAGGGLAWAEARMKDGAFAVERAPQGTRPDLTGLSCRFEPAASRQGLIVSMIVRLAPGGESGRFRQLVEHLLDLIEASPDMARPLPDGGPAMTWPSAGLDLEARLSRPVARSRWLHRLITLARTALVAATFRLRLPIGGFRPVRYVRQLVANSDYRKYDDGLRLTIDCTRALADEIEARLIQAERDGTAIFGLHRQTEALVTCITPSASRRDHIHFVDGAAGGYAAAAAAMKTGIAAA